MNYFNENESTIIHDVKKNNLSLEELLKNDYNFSSRLLKKLEINRGILLNNNRAKLKKKVAIGDIITILMEDESEPNIPEDILLDIIYEDYDLIIINKQPNIVVHPTKSHVNGTLANGLAFYFRAKGINKKVRFVNRLDMDTSGVLVVAKNPFGHQQMSAQFENDTTEKKYLALVEGIVQNDSGIIDVPIGKGEDDIRNQVVQHGKESYTRYEIVKRLKNATLVQLTIDTGRTHQIRVHMKHIGHPIVGDTLYNQASELIDRQALHSYSLSFNKPRTGERIEIKAELPQDMINLIHNLK